jgi:hypothetical protein
MCRVIVTVRQHFADTIPSPRQGLLITFFDYRCRRFRIDLRGFELRMPEKLLDLLSGHPPFQQRRRHRVAQRGRMDALGDAR